MLTVGRRVVVDDVCWPHRAKCPSRRRRGWEYRGTISVLTPIDRRGFHLTIEIAQAGRCITSSAAICSPKRFSARCWRTRIVPGPPSTRRRITSAVGGNDAIRASASLKDVPERLVLGVLGPVSTRDRLRRGDVRPPPLLSPERVEQAAARTRRAFAVTKTLPPHRCDTRGSCKWVNWSVFRPLRRCASILEGTDRLRRTRGSTALPDRVRFRG